MDDFERELRKMLDDRVAAMTPPADASPELLTRARRRRAAKLTALGVSFVIVAGGMAGAVAQVAKDDGPHRVITTTPTTIPRPSVQTVVCPKEYSSGLTLILPGAPSTAPRTPTAGDPEVLANVDSYAAADDPQFVVLGPKSWTCAAKSGESVAMGLISPDSGQSSTIEGRPIAIESYLLDSVPWNAKLWCLLPDQPPTRELGELCDPASSIFGTVTRVNSHLTTFVARSGARGVGWTFGESSTKPSITILTCRPTTGLTAAECDTIVADYAARLSALPPPTTTTSPSTSTSTSTTTSTTTTLPATVPTVVCPVTYASADHTTANPSTAPRVPAGDPALFSQLSSFAATEDPRFVALGPPTWSCEGQMATDGDNAFVIYQTAGPGSAAPDIFTAPIAIESDWLWHGGVGSVLACRVTGDAAAVQYVTQYFPQELPCPTAGRTVTSIDAHAWSFVDTDGARGGVWMVLPSGPSVDDGKIGVLTCRPNADLSAAECDTVIADWIARNDTTG